jgi:hypothetical protein
MKTFMKYLPGFNMFVAGVMLVLMVGDFTNGNIPAGILSAVIMAGNLYSYFEIQNHRDQNESLR